MDDIDNYKKYKTPLSSENGRRYNHTWNDSGLIVSTMTSIPTERWPFKLKDETEEDFQKRMDSLK